MNSVYVFHCLFFLFPLILPVSLPLKFLAFHFDLPFCSLSLPIFSPSVFYRFRFCCLLTPFLISVSWASAVFFSVLHLALIKWFISIRISEGTIPVLICCCYINLYAILVEFYLMNSWQQESRENKSSKMSETSRTIKKEHWELRISSGL